MGRLLSIAFGAVFVLSLIAQFVGTRQTFSATSTAAVQDPALTQSAGPWGNAPTTSTSSTSRRAVDRSGSATVIGRDASGQFHIHATVNGRDAEFLVDTGADLVSLGMAEAERLGLNVAPSDFRPMLRTASGTANGARVRIDRLVVSGQELHDIDAVVTEGLDTNLLGQSALRRLGKVELQGDHMVIHPG